MKSIDPNHSIDTYVTSDNIEYVLSNWYIIEYSHFFFLIRIYLITNSFELNHNNILTSTNSIVTAYLCPQLVSSSKGYFHVDFTDNLSSNYSTICKSDDILLIYILSKANHIERRKAIRRTWANKHRYEQLMQICFIFLLGLTDINSQEIRSEAAIYNDMVQLNINESYQNIVYKEVGGLKWSHMYASHIPYLFKTDDDIIIDTLLLSDLTKYFIGNRIEHSDYIQKQDLVKNCTQQMASVDKYTLFKGIYINEHKTIRRGKFALSSLAWNSDRLPVYCSGAGYIFSSFVRDRLYRASLCYAMEYVPWMGDLFVSGFLASAAAVQCTAWPMEYSRSPDGCSLRFQNQAHLLVCSTPMHMGRLDMEEYDRAWAAILQRHSITNETIKKAKRKHLALLNLRLQQNLSIKESIIEQMQNESLDQDAPIIPLNRMEDKLD